MSYQTRMYWFAHFFLQLTVATQINMSRCVFVVRFLHHPVLHGLGWFEEPRATHPRYHLLVASGWNLTV